jgi:putative DNA primase/helicase
LAAMYNDCLLPLDELGNSRGKDVDNVIYLIGNGKGKNRAVQKGTAKKIQEWQVSLLSNGEKTLEQHLKSDGIVAKGGQSVRFLEIPVFGKHGAFDALHGFADGGAFAVEIQKLAESYYGVAGIAFLEKLVVDTRDFASDLNFRSDNFKLDNMCNQEGRAVRAFALAAMAGELATEYGITGWKEGAATLAVQKCLLEWRKQKGSGNSEDLAILTAVRDYIDRYGDLRFTARSPSATTNKLEPSVERSGWFDSDGTWYFHSAGLKKAAEGHDFGQVKKSLLSAGWLTPGQDGSPTTQIKAEGQNKRLYTVKIPEN